jgi:hypothetical protein
VTETACQLPEVCIAAACGPKMDAGPPDADSPDADSPDEGTEPGD